MENPTTHTAANLRQNAPKSKTNAPYGESFEMFIDADELLYKSLIDEGVNEGMGDIAKTWWLHANLFEKFINP